MHFWRLSIREIATFDAASAWFGFKAEIPLSVFVLLRGPG